MTEQPTTDPTTDGTPHVHIHTIPIDSGQVLLDAGVIFGLQLTRTTHAGDDDPTDNSTDAPDRLCGDIAAGILRANLHFADRVGHLIGVAGMFLTAWADLLGQVATPAAIEPTCNIPGHDHATRDRIDVPFGWIGADGSVNVHPAERLLADVTEANLHLDHDCADGHDPVSHNESVVGALSWVGRLVKARVERDMAGFAQLVAAVIPGRTVENVVDLLSVAVDVVATAYLTVVTDRVGEYGEESPGGDSTD